MLSNLLKLNLQFFAADGGEFGSYYGDGGEQGQGQGEAGTGEKEQPKEDMIPKKRFDDINNRYKALNDDYKNRQTEYDDMMKKVTDSEATVKQLQDTIDAGNKRVEALEGILGEMLEAEMADIDEAFHELVPTDKPIEEQLKWIATAKQKGMFGSRGIEFEIGGLSNGSQGSKGGIKIANNASPIELLTMGYSK